MSVWVKMAAVKLSKNVFNAAMKKLDLKAIAGIGMDLKRIVRM